MEIWQNRSPLCCCSVKAQCIFVDYCKLKTNFIVKSQLLYMGCPLSKRESVNKRKIPIFIFKSVRVRLRESGCSRECVNTELNWEVKRVFEKASLSRAVRLRECPLAESWLYSYLFSVLIATQLTAYKNHCNSLHALSNCTFFAGD